MEDNPDDKCKEPDGYTRFIKLDSVDLSELICYLSGHIWTVSSLIFKYSAFTL